MAYNASSDGTAALGRFSRIAQEEWEQLHSSLPQETLLAAARLIEASRRSGGRLHFSGIGKASYVAAYSASLFSSTGTTASWAAI